MELSWATASPLVRREISQTRLAALHRQASAVLSSAHNGQASRNPVGKQPGPIVGLSACRSSPCLPSPASRSVSSDGGAGDSLDALMLGPIGASQDYAPCTSSRLTSIVDVTPRRRRPDSAASVNRSRRNSLCIDSASTKPDFLGNLPQLWAALDENTKISPSNASKIRSPRKRRSGQPTPQESPATASVSQVGRSARFNSWAECL